MTTVFQVYTKGMDADAIILENDGVATLVKWGDSWDATLVRSTIRSLRIEVEAKYMSKTEFRKTFPKLFKQVEL